MFGNDDNQELDRNNLPIKNRSIADIFQVATPSSRIPSDVLDTRYLNTKDNLTNERFQFGIDQNIEAVRAGYQGGFELTGKALVQGIGEATLGTLEGIGYLLDAEQHANIINGTEKEYSNWFSDLMKSGKEYVNQEIAPIYQTEASQEGFAPRDATWWASNFANIASTLSLLIPAAGATKIASYAGKGLKALTAFDKASDTVKAANALMNSRKVGAISEGVTSAIFSRYMENTMEASGTYEQMYQEELAKGVDPQEAALKAGEAASTAWKNNWGNLVFDVAQYMSLTKGLNATNYASKAMRKSLLQKGLGASANIAQEGIEEGAQFVISQEAQRKARMGKDYEGLKDITSRISDYTEDPEFKASVLLGAVGGGVFSGLGGVYNKIQKLGDKNQLDLEKQKALDRGDTVTANKISDIQLMNTAYDHIAQGKLGDLRTEYAEYAKASDEELTKLGLSEEEISTFRERNKEIQNDLQFIEEEYLRLEDDSTKSPQLRKKALSDVFEKRTTTRQREAIQKETQRILSEVRNEDSQQGFKKKELETKLFVAKDQRSKINEKEYTKYEFGKQSLKKIDSYIAELEKELENYKEVKPKPTSKDADLVKQYAEETVADLNLEVLDSHIELMQTEEGQNKLSEDGIKVMNEAWLASVDDSMTIKEIDDILKVDGIQSQVKAKLRALANKAAETKKIPTKESFEGDVVNRYESTPLLFSELADIKRDNRNLTVSNIKSSLDFIKRYNEDKKFKEAVDKYYEKLIKDSTEKQTENIPSPIEVVNENAANSEYADGMPTDGKIQENDKAISQNHQFIMYAREKDIVKFFGVNDDTLHRGVPIALANTYGYMEFKEGGPYIAYNKEGQPVRSETNTLKDKDGNETIFLSDEEFRILNDPKSDLYGLPIQFEIPLNSFYNPNVKDQSYFEVILSTEYNGKKLRLGKLRGVDRTQDIGKNSSEIRELRKQLFQEWVESEQTEGTFISKRNDVTIAGRTNGHFNITGNHRNAPITALGKDKPFFLGVIVPTKDGKAEPKLNGGDKVHGIDPTLIYYDRDSNLKHMLGKTVMFIQSADGRYIPIGLYTSKLKEVPQAQREVNAIVDEMFSNEEFLNRKPDHPDSIAYLEDLNRRLQEYLSITLTYMGSGTFQTISLSKEADTVRTYRNAQEMKYGKDKLRGFDSLIMRVDANRINTPGYNEMLSDKGWLKTNLSPDKHILAAQVRMDISKLDKGKIPTPAKKKESATITKPTPIETPVVEETLDIEAKKADIERRRQEELGTKERRSFTDEQGVTSTIIITETSEGKTVRHRISRNGEVGGQTVTTYAKELSNEKIYEVENPDGYGYTDVEQVSVEGKRADKINAKYDAELAALEETIEQPTVAENEIVEQVAEEKAPSDIQENIEQIGYQEEGKTVKPLRITRKGRERGSRKSRERRVVDSVEYKRWNKQEELLWFNSKYPNIPVKVLEDLSKIADNGGIPLWGLFKNGAIYILDQAASGTVYHEAFHAVFHTLLNQKEADGLLNELKYSNKKYVSMSKVELEEVLADRFMDYKLTEGNDTKGLSDNIKDFFKRLYHLIQIAAERIGIKKGASIDSYMYRIDKGLYNKFSINQRFTKDVSRFRQQYDSGKLSPREESMAIGTINGVMLFDILPDYAEELGLKRNTEPTDVIRALIEEGYSLETLYASTYEQIEEDLNNEDLELSEEGRTYLTKLLGSLAKKNDDGSYIMSSLAMRAAQDLSVRYGIGISVDQIVSEEDVAIDEELEEGKPEGWQIDSFTEHFSKFSQRAKMAFATVDAGIDPAGYTIFENPIKVYNKLGKTLVNSLNEQDMIKRLDDLIEIYPSYESIKEKIQNDPNLRGEMWYNMGQMKTVEFIGQASELEYDSLTNSFSNEVRTFVSNRRNASADIITEWQSNFYASKYYNRSNGEITVPQEFKQRVEELSKQVSLLSPQAPLQKDNRDSLFTILKDLSIPVQRSKIEKVFTLDVEGKKRFQKFIGGTTKGLLNIVSDMVNGKDPFFNADIEGSLSVKAMANEIVKGTDDTFKVSFKNMEGKSIYTHVNNRFTLDFINQLKNSDPQTRKNIIDRYMETPFYKSSPIFAEFRNENVISKVSMAYIDGARENNKEDKIAYSNMTKAQLEAFQISQWFNYKYKKQENWGYYMIPPLADASIASFMYYKKDNEVVTRENLVKTAQQERDRIKWLQKRIKGIESQYEKWRKDQFDEDMPYLEKSLLPEELSDISYNLLKNGLSYQVFKKLNDTNGRAKEFGSDSEFETAVNKMIDTTLESEKDKMLTDGVLSKNKEGKYVDLTNMLSDRVVNDLNTQIDKYILNRMYMNVQTMFLFGGDVAAYKSKNGMVDYTDVFKRIKQVHSPQNKLSVDPTRTFTLKDGSQVRVREDYYNAYVQDPTEVEAIVSKNIELIDKLFPGPENEWIREEKYRKLNNTDAATFIDIFRAREIYIGTAQWTDALQEQYDAIIKGDPIGYDPKGQINVKKPFNYQHRFIIGKNGDVHVESTQIKNSEAVLTPQMAKGNPKLEKILEKMGYTFNKDGSVSFDPNKRLVDSVIFASAVKVGQFNTLNSVDDITGENVHQMKNSEYALQMETPEHYIDSEILAGTQMRKLVVQDLDKKATYIVNGKPMSGQELFDQYQEAIQRNIEESFEQLKKMFYKEDGSPDLSKIVNVLRKEVIERQLGDDMLKSLDWLNSEKLDTVLPLWHPHIVYNVEAIMHSYFKNNITKQKMFGPSLYNATSHGYEEENTKGLRKPQLVFAKDEKGNDYLKEVEVIMPAWTKDIYKHYIGKDGHLDINAVPEDLRMGIFYRIPTEGKYSMFHIKVIGFVEGVGGQIILPDEVTTIAGLDFDIDKLYGMMYNFKNTKDGMVKVSSGMDTKESRDNLLIDLQYAVLSHPDTIRKQLTPGNYNTLNEVKKEVLKLEGKESEELNVLLPSTYREVFERNMTGASLIGVGANQNVNHALVSEADFKFTEGIAFNKDNRKELSKLYNANGELISSALAQYLAAYVDNAKDPIASFLNLTLTTADLVSTMIRVGHDPRAVLLFIASPAAKTFSREIAKVGKSRSNISKVLKKLMIDIEDDLRKRKGYDMRDFYEYAKLSTSDRVTVETIIPTYKDRTSIESLKTDHSIYQLLASTFQKSDALVTAMGAMRYDSVNNAAGPRYADTEVLKRKWKKALKDEGKVLIGFKSFIESNKIPYLRDFYEKGILMPTGKTKFNVELYEKVGEDAYSISLDYDNKRYSLIIDTSGNIDSVTYYNEGTLDDVESSILLSKEEIDNVLNDIYLIEKGESVSIGTDQETRNIIADIAKLPYEKSIFADLIERFGNYKKEGELNADEIDNIQRYIMTAMVSGYSTFAHSDMLRTIEDLPQRVLTYKNNNDGGAYSILMEQFTVTTDPVDKKNRIPFPYLKFDRTGLDNIHKNDVIKAWERMMYSENDTERQLAKDLAKYAFYSTGYTFNFNSFSDLVPVAFIAQLKESDEYQSYRDYLTRIFNKDFGRLEKEFLFEQIVRNGYRGLKSIPFIDPRTVDSAKKKEINGEMFLEVSANDVKFKGEDPISKKVDGEVEFIKVPMNTDKGVQTLLMELISTKPDEFNNVQYRVLERLGVHNQFMEFDINRLTERIQSEMQDVNVELENPIVIEEPTPSERKQTLDEVIRLVQVFQVPSGTISETDRTDVAKKIQRILNEVGMDINTLNAMTEEELTAEGLKESEIKAITELPMNVSEEIIKRCGIK